MCTIPFETLIVIIFSLSAIIKMFFFFGLNISHIFFVVKISYIYMGSAVLLTQKVCICEIKMRIFRIPTGSDCRKKTSIFTV